MAGPDALRQGVRGGARAPLAGEEENVFWTEFEFPDRNVTVVSLRGTQFWRVSGLHSHKVYAPEHLPYVFVCMHFFAMLLAPLR